MSRALEWMERSADRPRLMVDAFTVIGSYPTSKLIADLGDGAWHNGVGTLNNANPTVRLHVADLSEKDALALARWILWVFE